MIDVKCMCLDFFFQFKTNRLQFKMGEQRYTHTYTYAFVYHRKVAELKVQNNRKEETHSRKKVVRQWALRAGQVRDLKIFLEDGRRQIKEKAAAQNLFELQRGSEE